MEPVSNVLTSVPNGDLPKGRYVGTWHGYKLRWKAGDREFIADTKDGVRGWAEVTVVVTESGVFMDQT